MSSPENDHPDHPDLSGRPSRRAVIGAVGAGALLAAAGGSAAYAAATSGRDDILTRVIPKTGERIPAIGLGTFMTWDILRRYPRDQLREVMRRLLAGGARVVDTSALYGMSEENVGEAARALGVTDRLFITGKTWATGEYLNDTSHVDRQFATSQRLLSRRRLDVLQVHSLTNAEMVVPIHRRWKQEGRIRYLAVTHHVPAYFQALEHWIRTGDLDFVQFRYSIFMREAERRLLPLAADHGVAVLTNMSLEKGRLHAVVKGRPLPGLARELGCETWAQFFLKYVLAHPNVTCVLTGTGNPGHMSENLAALWGPLPDGALRRQMVRHMQGIPGFAEIDDMPWYPGRTWDKGLVRL
jgi:diketogulonate reductase-like aldo/keto reductase